ncbi:Pogo transposable element with ZNF domain [Fusarium oxysporum f. sp. conglutinans]|nr:Pogo transposable element with ZNF domain [Fusarium oxysporum f. sp. conglutinans]
MVRRNYTEDDVAEAILDTTDRGLSQNEAAQKRGVPQSTLSGRLSGQASRNERIQAHQRIPKSQEETLIRWVLRQESLGYAPSHSQLRACVEAILKQQGDNKPLGKHWTTRFVKRHLELSTKLGKRQEAARFDGFTPKAVNWYFDIRENEYGWIKPENTVNVDEGGIMVGFGLDSLVIGSSDPKKKAMLKGVQSRTWTSFIEAVTATGRALKPGIIFKGKELQKQWFLNEFELIADWHYITSPNGWTDNHIALEWLKDVYLPQTEPRDASDARLIILDGHGSHAQDEWMATCFLNNVYCCYLPAHCSHGLQPLDNGIFNVIKGAYRKELQKLASLTDSAPVDKVHFIRAYAKAREAGMGKDIILSGWRFTGNWPINRHKALTHPEIQPDKEKVPERFKTPSPPQLHSDDTPKTSRQVRDLAKHRSRPTRRKYSKIAKGLEALEMKVAVQNARITGLEEQMAQVRRGKKRKAVPNPNRRFMTLAETLTAGEALPDSKKAEIEVDVDEKDESVIEVGVSLVKRVNISFARDSYLQNDQPSKSTFRFEASDQRDRIYSLRGMAKGDQVMLEQLKIDYEAPTAKVYQDFASIAAQQDPEVIVLAESAGQRRTDLPSWVPDWSSILLPPAGYDGEEPIFGAGLKKDYSKPIVAGDALVVSGVPIDSIMRVGRHAMVGDSTVL